jgi:hypothetical protein
MTGMGLLAFGFASPWLLWGLAAAGAPILIHLLSRRKPREMTWAAMRFLLEAVRKNSRRLQMEQWILLALRTLILVLLTMALARPTFETLGTFFQADLPAHRILVLDASLSMGAKASEEAGGATGWDRAKQLARKIVDEPSQGDAWQLVRLSSLPPQTIIKAPAYQAQAVGAEIDALVLPAGPADAARGLAQVVELLKSVPALPRKEVYIVSDFQGATWTPAEADETARLKEQLRAIGDAAQVVLIDVGTANRENIAVTGVALVDPLAVVGRAARVRVSVRNHGREEVTNFPVELLVDGRPAEVKRVRLGAGEEWSDVLTAEFATGGEHRLSVRIPDDDLAVDNERQVAVSVRDRLKVLLVSGRAGTGPLTGATDFLLLALDPRQAGPGSVAAAPGAGPIAGGTAVGGTGVAIEPTVISEGEFSGTDLSRFQAVFLCDVRTFTPREVRQLESYVRGGGGVIWSLGGNVSVEDYNQLLWRDGQGLLPAKLGARMGTTTPEAGGAAFDFRVPDYGHPLVNAFEGNQDAGLETTRTFAYLKAERRAGAATSDGATRGAGAGGNGGGGTSNSGSVALQFDGGDPAVVEQRVGAGRAILVTTSLDSEWTSWPLWPSYVPMMQELALFAVTGRSTTQAVLVGSPIEQTVRTNGLDVQVSIVRPDGAQQPATVTVEGPLATYRYDETDAAGVYEARFTGVELAPELHAVNVDTRESDLAKLDEAGIVGDLAAGMPVTYQTDWTGRTKSTGGPKGGPVVERAGGLTRWLLLAAMYLLLVEQVMAWRFAWGAAMLWPVMLLRRRR